MIAVVRPIKAVWEIIPRVFGSSEASLNGQSQEEPVNSINRQLELNIKDRLNLRNIDG